MQNGIGGHCGCGRRCPRDNLLASLLQFLRHDLASEKLSERCQLAQRSLLDRLAAMKLEDRQAAESAGRRGCCCLTRCPAELWSEPPLVLAEEDAEPKPDVTVGAATDAAASAVAAAAAAVTRRGKKSATVAVRDTKNRMSLPPQMFSIASKLGSSPPTVEKATCDEVDYEEPWSPSRSNAIVLPSKLTIASRRQSLAGWPSGSALVFPESQQQQQLLMMPGLSGSTAAIMSGQLQLRQSDSGSGRWTRFAHCALQGSRLLCYRSGHQARVSHTLQLAGYAAVYSDRESGASHVIKLTHPSLPTHALAADSESEARMWIAALNSACGGGSGGLQPPLMSSTTSASAFRFSYYASSSSASNSNDSCGGGVVGGCYEVQQSPTNIDRHRRGSLPPSLSSSLSFSPETSPVHHAVAAAGTANSGECAKPLSKSPAEGLIRRFRGSFGAGSGVGDKSSASTFPTASPDALVSGLVSAKLLPAALPSVTAASGQQPAVGHWSRRFAQLLPSSCLQLADPDGGSTEYRLPLAQLRIGPLQDDRKRRSGLRLYCEADGRDWLLLDVTDKTRLGTWIKQLILATAPCYDTPALPSRAPTGCGTPASPTPTPGAAPQRPLPPTPPSTSTYQPQQQQQPPPPPRRQLPDLPGGVGGLSLACLTADSRSHFMDGAAAGPNGGGGPALKTRLLLQQGWAS